MLEQDERLATIDFTKTTPFGMRPVASKNEAELLREPVLGRDGVEMIKWKSEVRHEPLTGDKTITPMLPRGERVRSSLSDISNRVAGLERGLDDRVRNRVEEVLVPFREEVRERLTTTRNFGIGSLVAAGIAVVVIIFQLQQSAASALVPSDSRLDRLTQEIAVLETQIAAGGTTDATATANAGPEPTTTIRQTSTVPTPER